VDKNYASCVAVVYRGETRNTKLLQGKFGEATNQLEFTASITKHSQDDKEVNKVVGDASEQLQMTKLANTLKGVLKNLKAKRERTKKVVFTFEGIKFSDEFFNSGVPEGDLAKTLLPIDYTKPIKNKATKKSKTHTHCEALILWRAYVHGSATHKGDESDGDDSVDEMQQLANWTAGLKIWTVLTVLLSFQIITKDLIWFFLF